ncbi:MAG: Integral membrane protein TerC [Parcubacteria group bacterium GW2011_GWE2_38_18]|nr:MAG: Integral membrane protein TerC [Parcubacteria group bacterium GW2011_GWE2_38_18]
MDNQTSLFVLFGFVVTLFLVADLGFFNRKSHKVEFKSAIYQSLFWVAVSVIFGFLIFLYMDREMAAQFLSAYVTEKMLSLDNLFVILLIFSYFKLEEKYHHRVLFYGILGAIFFRAIFIGAGALIIAQFHWILYVFGVILIYTGIKLFEDKKEEHIDFEKNKVVVFARRFLPFTVNHHNGHFLVREHGKLLFTSLFLIVLLIEATDIIFAVDSIPAAFAISQKPFIVFTSNIFAILGMRSLFFVLEGVMHKFHHLQKGLSFILVFIGLKMLSGLVGVHISSLLSFSIIMSALLLSLLASVLYPKKF